MTSDEPAKKLWPKLYSFSVRLDGQKWFFPCSAFACGEDRAKAILNERFSGKIVEWNRICAKMKPK